MFKNLDANETVFFNRELERIKTRIFEKKYKDLMFRKLFPIDNQGGPGIESVTVRVWDQVGVAKIIGGYSDDLPRADVKGKEITVPIRTIGTSFAYNVQEVAAAALVNRPLQTMRADAARRAVEEKLNNIAFGSDQEATDAGLLGLFTHPNIPTSNVVNPGGGTQWVNKTPDQILFDINDAFAEIHENTKMRERPTRLLLPVRQWNLIAATPRSANSDTTILQYVVRNSPFITSPDQIMPLVELDGAGTGGADIMVAYDPDPDKLEMDIPHELDFLPVQERGLSFLVPGWAKAGGLHIYRPLSLLIKEGI